MFASLGEWVITVFVLSMIKPAFDSWFLRKRLVMGREVLAEWDSPELQQKIAEMNEKEYTGYKDYTKVESPAEK